MTQPSPAPAPAPTPTPAPAPAPAPAATIIAPPSPAPAPAPAPSPQPAPAAPKPGDPPAPAATDPAAGDWRTRMAGGDADSLKRLGRFADEGAFYKSYKALEAKLSSGEYKRALPDGASAEEIATWRKENGLPDKAEGYITGLKLPQGVVLGEADKPLAQDFAAHAMTKNWSQQQYNDALEWYYGNVDKQATVIADADASYHDESVEQLREVWQGSAYKQNVTAVNNLIAGWPEGLGAAVLGARDEKGRKLGDNPGLIQQLASLALELNPAYSLVPAGTGDQGKAMQTRIAEIEAMMKPSHPQHQEYQRNEAIRTEYRNLLDAQSKMKERTS